MGWIWSEAARDKLEKETDLYLKAALFIYNFKPQNDVLKAAWDNMIAIMQDLRLITDTSSSSSSVEQKDDVSSIINDCRSKVVNQLQFICDNHVSQAFTDFLVRFKAKLHKKNAADNGTENKGNASQLTKLDLQQQKDDEKKVKVCLDKQYTVRLFSQDYLKTVRFMRTFINFKGPPNQDTVLIDAFFNISKAYRYLFNVYGYNEEDNWYHLDVSQLIKEYKSKLETELKEVCNNASDPTIKEAFSRHLTEVTAQNHRPQDEKRTSNMSIIRKKKKSTLLLMRKEVYSAKYRPSCLEVTHHSQCCFKRSAFGRIRAHPIKSPPKAAE